MLAGKESKEERREGKKVDSAECKKIGGSEGGRKEDRKDRGGKKEGRKVGREVSEGGRREGSEEGRQGWGTEENLRGILVKV